MDIKERRLKQVLEKIFDFFSRLREPVDLFLEDDALEAYNKWAESIDLQIKNASNEEERDILGAVWTRLKDYVLKIAMLKHVNDNVDQLELLGKLKIPKSTIEYAIKIFEEYAKAAFKIIDLLQGHETDRILNLIKKHGGTISRSQLLRASGLNAQKLDAQLELLERQERIFEIIERTSCKPRVIYKIKERK